MRSTMLLSKTYCQTLHEFMCEHLSQKQARAFKEAHHRSCALARTRPQCALLHLNSNGGASSIGAH